MNGARGRPRTTVWILCPRGAWKECDGMEELFLELGVSKQERGLVREALSSGDPFINPRTNMLYRVTLDWPSGPILPLRIRKPRAEAAVARYPLMRRPVTSCLGHLER